MTLSRQVVRPSVLVLLVAACTTPVSHDAAPPRDAGAQPDATDDADTRWDVGVLLSPGVREPLRVLGATSPVLDNVPELQVPPEELTPSEDAGPPPEDADIPVEEIPGLCSLTLDCGRTIPNEPQIPCDFQVTDDEGIIWYDGLAGVDVRGRSSRGFPKHQYAVELWDEIGVDTESDLLGFGEESDWVVNGAYVDRALVRNQFAFDIFRAMGGWAPESSPCTLTLDGTWLGIFFLTERARRGEDRIDLFRSSLGHSFIAILDEGPSVVSFQAAGVGHGGWRLVYPRQATATEAQIAGATAWLRGWLTAIQSADPSDPETGVFAWVDKDSAVDFVLLEELVKNCDAYYLSVYVYKEHGGRLHFSPWDLDLSIGQPLYNNNTPPEGWVRGRRPWVGVMGTVPGFQDALADRWFELREDLFSEEELLARLERQRATLGDTVYENFEVWPIEDIQFFRNQLPLVSSYDQEYQRVRDWIPRRLAWIDDNIYEW